MMVKDSYWRPCLLKRGFGKVIDKSCIHNVEQLYGYLLTSIHKYSEDEKETDMDTLNYFKLQFKKILISF